jgi:sugar lactone lactonase YvrE
LQAALIVNRMPDPDAPEAFADALRAALEGIDLTVVVLDCPIPLGKPGYGPENHPYLAPDAPGKDRMEVPAPDPWRAPLGEQLLFEIAKWRFLSTARAVLVLDATDILPMDAPPAFDRCVEARHGVVLLVGRRIYPWRVRPRGEARFGDGHGEAAHFNLPFGLAIDAQENIYVADQSNHRIRKVSRSGVVSTLAGSGSAGFRDGPADQAQFDHPSGLALLPDGALLVADSWNHRLRRIDAQGQVSTWAGTGVPGLTEGPRLSARLYAPDGVAVGPDGTVYVADTFNHRVRRILPDGTVQSLAGNGELLLFGAGFANGRGTNARFNQPRALTLGRDGLLYVADTHNSRLRRLQP